jgi:hypothetical protein
MYRKTRAEGFGPEVKRRIMIGTYVLSHGYYDAYYLQAQKLRRMIADDFQAAFQVCDVIAGPVSPTVARPSAHSTDPVAGLPGRHLHPARIAGWPAWPEPALRFRRTRLARGPAADRQLLARAQICCTRRTPSSKPPTGTSARPPPWVDSPT